ncbi:MAG: glycine oxidase ThiO [Anaerolineae bacterium]
MNRPVSPVLIIGGGVFGLAIGWELARQGQSVTVLEQNQAGRGASWAAAGMLMPWKLSDAFSEPLFALQRHSHRLWPDFAAELTRAGGMFLAYQMDGRYFLATTEQSATRLRRQYEYHHGVGLPVEWLSGKQARRQLPALGGEVVAAVFSPAGHWVDNRQVALALREAFMQAGGNLREQSRAQGIVVEENRVCGVRLADGTVPPANTVVVAAGAWSSRLEGLPLLLRNTVQPRKGQTLVLQMDAAAPLVRHNLIGPVYMVPRPDGRLVVGTTVEREAGFNTQPTAGGVFQILRKARQIVPAVDDLPLVEISAGLRPTGPERLPLLGPTQVEGLLAAMGGHSYGILLAPVVGQSLAQVALTGRVPEIILPFLP